MAAIQHILAANQQRRRARSQMVYINTYVRQHFSLLNVLSDRAVQSKYRLPRVEIKRLVMLVSPHIQRATRCNFALSPMVQLLAAQRFYAVGSFLEVVGWHRPQQGMAWRPGMAQKDRCHGCHTP